MSCAMCQIRSTLKKAMDEIDVLPEINSALYDDTVVEAYSALETAYYMHQHYCDESAQQMREPDSSKAGDSSPPDVVKSESNLPA